MQASRHYGRRGLAAYDGAAERGLSAQAPKAFAKRRPPQGRPGARTGRLSEYAIELFGRRLEVVELGTAAWHQVGVETQVSLPRERCWAYRDTGPVAYE